MVDQKQLLYTCTYADGVEQRGTALEDVHRRADQRMSLLGQRPTGDGWTFDHVLDAYVRTVEDAYGRTLVGATVRATYVPAEPVHAPDLVSAGEVVTGDTVTADGALALVPLVSTSGEPLEVMAPGEPSWAAQVEAEATADLDPRDIVGQVDDLMATIARAEGVLEQMAEVDLLGDSPEPPAQLTPDDVATAATFSDPYVWDAARSRIVRQSELEPTPPAQVEVSDGPVPLAEYLPVVEEPPAPVVPEVSDEAWLAQRTGQAILDERERMEQGELVTVFHNEEGHLVPFVYGTAGEPLPSFEEMPAVEAAVPQSPAAWAWTTADGDGWTYAGSCEEAQAAAEAASYVTTTGEWQWSELPWVVLPDEVEEPLPMGMVSNSTTTGKPYIMVAPVSVLEDVGIEVDGVERVERVRTAADAASTWRSVGRIIEEEVPLPRRVTDVRRVGAHYQGSIEVTTPEGERLTLPTFAILGVMQPDHDGDTLLILSEGVSERLVDLVVPDSPFLPVVNAYEDVLAALYEQRPEEA